MVGEGLAEHSSAYAREGVCLCLSPERTAGVGGPDLLCAKPTMG